MRGEERNETLMQEHWHEMKSNAVFGHNKHKHVKRLHDSQLLFSFCLRLVWRVFERIFQQNQQRKVTKELTMQLI